MIATLAQFFFALAFLLLLGGALILVSDAGTRRAFRIALHKRVARLRPPRVAIVGDSLAAQCDWRRLGSRPFDVLRLAVGGATLKDIGAQIVEARMIGVRCFVIDGGLNDLLFDEAPLAQIDHDFRALLRRLPENARGVLMLSPHVADPAQAPRIDEANRLMRALAEARGLAVVDLQPRLSEGGARRLEMTDDGLHFSPLATEIWVEAVCERLSGERLSRKGIA
ncbi:SGNH/GDSL hydrolase family protein [Methylosinus sp. H3A]|uniref:SGNH/GDSL hydrolase family protein n=1 Tax=Methylosinus sp. H3A TaxID=2785786 RepID=UPI0018C21BB7|nr:SGNH/GDSL hydrolase family protein [Methylosinus sp. H3A]MBG0810155.1 SGNH/GDSL hydrolase family protein [Methylosinus sp. H3A]